MLKFTIAEGKVIVDPLHASLDIVKKVTNKYKTDAVAVLTYIHLMSRIDPSAPFFTAQQDELQELVKRQLFTDTQWKKLNKKQLSAWVEEYKKMYEPPEVRAVNIFNEKIDQIQRLIKDTEPEIIVNTSTSGVTTFASNLKIITDTMKELETLLTAKEKLEAKIRKETTLGKMRAGKTPSMLEKKMMKK